MYCFKTDETLFEDVLPFHAKTSPTAQYSLSSTAKEVLANDKILI